MSLSSTSGASSRLSHTTVPHSPQDTCPSPSVSVQVPPHSPSPAPAPPTTHPTKGTKHSATSTSTSSGTAFMIKHPPHSPGVKDLHPHPCPSLRSISLSRQAETPSTPSLWKRKGTLPSLCVHHPFYKGAAKAGGGKPRLVPIPLPEPWSEIPKCITPTHPLIPGKLQPQTLCRHKRSPQAPRERVHSVCTMGVRRVERRNPTPRRAGRAVPGPVGSFCC